MSLGCFGISIFAQAGAHDWPNDDKKCALIWLRGAQSELPDGKSRKVSAGHTWSRNRAPGQAIKSLCTTEQPLWPATKSVDGAAQMMVSVSCTN